MCIYHTSSTYMFIFVQIFRLLNHKLIINNYMQTVHFQFSSVTESCSTLCDPMDPSTPGLPVHHQLPELIQTISIELVMPSNHLILCYPLLLPSIFPSIRVFSNESAIESGGQSIGFSASASVKLIHSPSTNESTQSPSMNDPFIHSPSNEYSGLISFRMDWLDLLVVQETLKSLFQHHSSKASILWRSAFFTVQLSHPYMTTGKTIVLARRTFVGKVISLLFNKLSRLVITFLSRSKCLFISWLQSPSAVILGPKKIKSVIVSTVSPSISHEVMGSGAVILVF